MSFMRRVLGIERPGEKRRGDRAIKVQMERRNGDKEEKVYQVRTAMHRNGFLMLYQWKPIHKEVIEDGETRKETEIRDRELWINKDFIISIEDPYRPHDSETSLSDILKQDKERPDTE